MRDWIISICVVLACGVLGTAPLVLSTHGQQDAASLYLIVAPAPHGRPLPSGVYDVGADRMPLARLVQAAPDRHAALIDSGAWVLPAGKIAALCGRST